MTNTPPENFDQDAPENGVLLIPWQQLSQSALMGVVEEFINREGTDYGEHEVSFEVKIEQVLGQVKSGKAVVLFDPVLENCQLARREQVPAGLLSSL